MATALIKIDVATLSAGVNDASRVDGVPNQVVTLTQVGTGGSTYLWRFFEYTGDQTVPTISNPTTTVATFTPNGGASGYGQTFGIELVVDSTIIARRIYAIPTKRQGLILPVYGQKGDKDSSRQNNGAAYIAASTDNAASNYQNYHPRMAAWMKQYEIQSGLLPYHCNPNTQTGQIELYVAPIYLPICTVNNWRAWLGCQSSGDSAILKLYRSSDSSLISTMNPGAGVPQARVVSNFSIAQEGWYELHLYGGSDTTISYCRGGVFDIKA